MFEDDSKIGNYSEELETGIFNMVISLCQHKADEVGIDEAKVRVIEYLERLIDGLK